MPCWKYICRNFTGLLVLLVLATVAGAAQTAYRGNVQTGIFHQPSCRYFDCKKCTAVFDSRAAALQAGFRPCKVCRP